MEIKFYWNGSFVGCSYHMSVNGDQTGLGFFVSENEAKLNAIKLLKEYYNVDYNIDNIIFEWGGEL